MITEPVEGGNLGDAIGVSITSISRIRVPLLDEAFMVFVNTGGGIWLVALALLLLLLLLLFRLRFEVRLDCLLLHRLPLDFQSLIFLKMFFLRLTFPFSSSSDSFFVEAMRCWLS